MYKAKPRILIVENDEDTLFLIEAAFTREGYTVETCTAGAGIVEFKHPVPDLYILDQGLPTIDGIALSKFLRLQERTKDVPIIMVSGQQLKNKAMQVGIDEFIKKPFSIAHLLDVVRKCLQATHKYATTPW